MPPKFRPPIIDRRSQLRRHIVQATQDTKTYVLVDLTGSTDAQDIRKRILSELGIPHIQHPDYAIYHIEFGGELTTGIALDNSQLFGDFKQLTKSAGCLQYFVDVCESGEIETDYSDLPTAGWGLGASIWDDRHNEQPNAEEMDNQPFPVLTDKTQPTADQNINIHMITSRTGIQSTSLPDREASKMIKGKEPAIASDSDSIENHQQAEPEVPNKSNRAVLECQHPSNSRNRQVADTTVSPLKTFQSTLTSYAQWMIIFCLDLFLTALGFPNLTPVASVQLMTINIRADLDTQTAQPPSQKRDGGLTPLVPIIDFLAPQSHDRDRGAYQSPLIGSPELINQLNQLKFIECAAAGASSDIYRVTFTNGNKVALKCYRSANESRTGGEQIARELHVWSKGRHPYISELLAVVPYRHRIALISPWADNGHLRQFLSRPQGKNVNRYLLSAQIADGISWLHNVEIVHGDLMGSPEILEDKTGNTVESDVYALGMTILETLTGARPYNEVTKNKVVLDNITSGIYPLRSKTHLPIANAQADDVWSLLVRCWDYNPQARPTALNVQEIMMGIALGGQPKSLASDPNESQLDQTKMLITPGKQSATVPSTRHDIRSKPSIRAVSRPLAAQTQWSFGTQLNSPMHELMLPQSTRRLSSSSYHIDIARNGTQKSLPDSEEILGKSLTRLTGLQLPSHDLSIDEKEILRYVDSLLQTEFPHTLDSETRGHNKLFINEEDCLQTLNFCGNPELRTEPTASTMYTRHHHSPSSHSTLKSMDPCVIGNEMTIKEILEELTQHGCNDVTHQLGDSQSEYPVSTGGFGDIYRGTLKDGRAVSLKCVRLMIDLNDSGRKKLKHTAQELYVWSKCNHPNVMALIGVVQYRNQLAMVSTWMENGNMCQFLRRHPRTDRCLLCAQITDGVAYLHREGIVHGDIKGVNILIASDQTPKISDFGNAALKECSLRFADTDSQPALSIRWAAPELLEGSMGTTAHSDIYALGMVSLCNQKVVLLNQKPAGVGQTILEALTGKVPYDGIREIALLLKVTRKIYPDRPEMHIGSKTEHGDMIWSLLSNCWAYEPQLRPTAPEVQSEMKLITEKIEKTTHYDHTI